MRCSVPVSSHGASPPNTTSTRWPPRRAWCSSVVPGWLRTIGERREGGRVEHGIGGEHTGASSGAGSGSTASSSRGLAPHAPAEPTSSSRSVVGEPHPSTQQLARQDGGDGRLAARGEPVAQPPEQGAGQPTREPQQQLVGLPASAAFTPTPRRPAPPRPARPAAAPRPRRRNGRASRPRRRSGRAGRTRRWPRRAGRRSRAPTPRTRRP